MHKASNHTEASSRQQLLLDQLYSAMLEMPYSEISVIDLCQRVGISRKSFYRYFGSKDGCLNALLDQMLLNSLQTDHSGFQQTGPFSPKLLSMMAYWKKQKPLLDLILSNRLESNLLARCYQHVVHEDPEMLRWLGIQDPTMDPEAIVFSVTGFVSLLLHWSSTGFQKSPEQMAHVIYHMMTEPLMNRNTAQ